MPVPIPDGESAVEISKWFIATLISGLALAVGAIKWLVTLYTGREAKVINSNTMAVENLADVVEANTASTDVFGDHLQKANELEHDRQLLAADRRQRSGDS